MSAYSVMEENLTKEEKEYYLEEIDFWLDHSANLQVDSTDTLHLKYNESITKKARVLEKELSVGGFLTDINEPAQRIDFTQHCLSAFLQKMVDIDGELL